MATTPSRIFVNGDAHVFIGPVGTTAPTHPNGPFDSALVEVGLFTDDSLSFATEPNFETVTSHQSNYPTRRMQTADEATLEVDLQEWSDSNFVRAFGGGDITETSAGSGIWKFTPPALGAREEVMVVVQCIDGTKHATLVIPRAQQVEGVEQDLGKGTESLLPLRLSILGSGSGDPFYWLFDDTAAFSGAVPVLTSRTPTSGAAAGGVAINVVGTGLQNVTAVKFGKTGTATAGGASTLTDSGASFTTNAFAGYTLEILTGTGAGQSRTVASNTATAITVSVAWDTAPDATSTYRVSRNANSFFYAGAGTQLTAYSPPGVNGQTVDIIFIHTVSATPVTGTGWHAYTA